MSNKLFQLIYFPRTWKTRKKGGKPADSHKSFKANTILQNFGEIYEKLILTRIGYTLAHNDKLSGNQYGFTPLKSTEIKIEQTLSHIDRYKLKDK